MGRWTTTMPAGAVFGDTVYTQSNTGSGGSGEYRCAFRFGHIPKTRTVVIWARAETRATSSSFPGDYSNGPTVSEDGTHYTDGTVDKAWSSGRTWNSAHQVQYWVSENVRRGQVFYCRSIYGENPAVTFEFIPDIAYLPVRVNGEWKDAQPFVKIGGEWKEPQPYAKVSGVWKEAT